MWWRHQLLAAEITSFRSSFYPHASTNTHTATGSGPIISLEHSGSVMVYWRDLPVNDRLLSLSCCLFTACAGVYRLKQDLKQQWINFVVQEYPGEGSTNFTFILRVLESCSQAVMKRSMWWPAGLVPHEFQSRTVRVRKRLRWGQSSGNTSSSMFDLQTLRLVTEQMSCTCLF